uniref:Uncharacterized protein n=1 Tax=Arundo donax TaxID=35708 RepID=A0A0A9A8M5_ARUDO
MLSADIPVYDSTHLPSRSPPMESRGRLSRRPFPPPSGTTAHARSGGR